MEKEVTAPNLSIRIANSINQVDAGEWDGLSAGQPFQSHNWHRFGERVMSDCEPVYILAYRNERLVGRASLWVIRNEPLPQFGGMWRIPFQFILKKRPLLICRSPLSNTGGIVISKNVENGGEIFFELIHAALDQARQRNCSFLVFDYLGETEKKDWTPGFSVMEVPAPGTVMENRWRNFDDYLTVGNKKDRQHYKRTLREAEKLRLTIHRSACADDIDELLPLIRNMERKYGVPANPWTRNMLKFMKMADGILLTVTSDDTLVGCGLLVEDNNAQMATALGLAPHAPYVYLTLVYEGIRTALERGIKSLRWGSGAYEIKKRLGFELEDNQFLAVGGTNTITRKIVHLLA